MIGISMHHCRKILGDLVPDNSSFVDKLTGAFRRRTEFSASFTILPCHRCMGIQEMVIFFRGDRNERDCSLCGYPSF